MSQDGGTQGIGRRKYLSGLAGALAGVGGLAASSGRAAATGETFPRVSTRDHFDITWYGDVYLTDGHTKWDYGTVGSVPGVDTAAPDELLVMVHGWRNDRDDAIDTFQGAERALRANGYDAPVIGYSWDSDTSYVGWWDAQEIARRNGAKLANFAYDYAQRNPDTTVRWVAHSLGAQVVLKALTYLNEAGVEIASLSMLGGAADNESVARSGEFGPAVAGATGRTDNFWKGDDAVLEWAYSTAELNAAVGEEGCDGTPPAGYEDHNVDYVPDHYSYYEPSEGCMPDVVAEF